MMQDETAEHTINITILSLNGKSLQLSVSDDDPIEFVHQKIADEREKSNKYVKYKKPCDERRTRLIFAGKGLEDWKTIESYSIQNGSTIHEVIRMGPTTYDVHVVCKGNNINFKMKTPLTYHSTLGEFKEHLKGLGIECSALRLKKKKEYRDTDDDSKDFLELTEDGNELPRRIIYATVDSFHCEGTLEFEYENEWNKNTAENVKVRKTASKEENAVVVYEAIDIEREDGIMIYLKRANGKTLSLYLTSEDTIGSIQQYIIEDRSKTKGYQEYESSDEDNAWRPRLVFAGKQLESDRTIESYSIQKESTIHETISMGVHTTGVDVLCTGENISFEMKAVMSPRGKDTVGTFKKHLSDMGIKCSALRLKKKGGGDIFYELNNDDETLPYDRKIYATVESFDCKRTLEFDYQWMEKSVVRESKTQDEEEQATEQRAEPPSYKGWYVLCGVVCIGTVLLGRNLEVIRNATLYKASSWHLSNIAQELSVSALIGGGIMATVFGASFLYQSAIKQQPSLH